VAAIVSSGSRYFLRQMVEPTVRNLFFVSHNEVPMEAKIVSLGVIQ
jgi:flagellar biosynthesis component FlhA